MNQQLQSLLSEIKAGLLSLYAARLKGTFLYGSWARGQADGESDLDVLVVLDDFESYAAEVDRTATLAAEVSLRHALSVSMVFLREHDWLEQDTPFLRNVREEAIPV